MNTALRLETTVLPGHLLEVSSSELPEGVKIEDIVVLAEAPQPRRNSLLKFVKSLPPGPRAFPTGEEYEKHL